MQTSSRERDTARTRNGKRVRVTTRGATAKSPRQAAMPDVCRSSEITVPGVQEALIGSGRASGKVLSKRRAATRAKLVEAARELIAENGIDGTSVEGISERAGFTRGAFYSNFDDIYDILAAVSIAEYADLEQCLETVWQARAAAIDPSEVDVFELVMDLLAAVGRERDFYLIQTELALQTVRHPHLRQKLNAPRESFINQLTQFLQAAVATYDLELRGDARTVTGMIVALLRHVTEVAVTSGEEPAHLAVDRAKAVIPLLIQAILRPVSGTETDAYPR